MPSTEATTTPVSIDAFAPTPIATTDSPSAMITIAPWRSAKWPGTSFQPSWPNRNGPPASSSNARPQIADLQAAGCGRGDEQQPGADGGAAGEPDHRFAQRLVVAAGQHEQHDVRRAHDRVGAREQQRLVAERARDADRGDQERGHRDEDHEPHGSLLGVDDARQPGVADPRPPQHPERQKALEHAAPGRRVHDQRRALRQREHEHEVEEQLQRRYPLVVAQHRADARRIARPGASSPSTGR